jgi:hypothetical protein
VGVASVRGEGEGSDGSEIGEAEDYETGFAFFTVFLNLETGATGLFYMCHIRRLRFQVAKTEHLERV